MEAPAAISAIPTRPRFTLRPAPVRVRPEPPRTAGSPAGPAACCRRAVARPRPALWRTARPRRPPAPPQRPAGLGRVRGCDAVQRREGPDDQPGEPGAVVERMRVVQDILGEHRKGPAVRREPVQHGQRAIQVRARTRSPVPAVRTPSTQASRIGCARTTRCSVNHVHSVARSTTVAARRAARSSIGPTSCPTTARASMSAMSPSAERGVEPAQRQLRSREPVDTEPQRAGLPTPAV